MFLVVANTTEYWKASKQKGASIQNELVLSTIPNSEKRLI